MAAFFYCLVLAGPIAGPENKMYTDGEKIVLPEADAHQLSRYGIVRIGDPATDPGEGIDKQPAPTGGLAGEEAGELTSAKETAAQKKKRLTEEAEAERLAAEEAAKTTETETNTEPAK
jgi:hypothetical protein